MKFISTKKLRATLPNVRRQLANGEEYLLIHQSKPIAKFSPVQNEDLVPNPTDVLGDFEQSSVQDTLNDEALSKKELDYYLSLPKYAAR